MYVGAWDHAAAAAAASAQTQHTDLTLHSTTTVYITVC